MTRTLTFSALVLVALLGSVSHAAPTIKNFPALTGGGGGGGAVSSVSGAAGGCGSVSPSTGAVIVSTTGCLAVSLNLSDLASASTARTNLGLGTSATFASSAFAQTANNLSDLASAGTARTNLGLGTASTQANSFFAQTANNLSDLASASTARTNLGLGTAAVQNVAVFAQTANNLSDLGSASTARTNLGLGSLATQSGTFSGTSSGTNTGDQTITLTGPVTGSGTGSIATTVAASIPGFTGGRTIYGGTAAADPLTLISTSNGTLGPIDLSSSSYVNAPAIIRLGATNNTELYSGGPGTFGLFLNGSQALSITYPTTQWAFIKYFSYSGSSAIAQSNGTTEEWGITPPTQVAATGAKLDDIKYDATTATFTGGTAISTNTLAKFDIEANTITDSTAVTISKAATFRIGGATIAGGSVTITNPLALQVAGGIAEFDGPVALAGNTLATPGSGVIVTTDAPSGVVSLSLKYINMQVNGVATYVLALQ